MDEGNLLRSKFGAHRSRQSRRMSRVAEFVIANKWLLYVFIICVGTLAVLYRPEANEPGVQSRALKRASWKTGIDNNAAIPRQKSFSRQRRAFVSALYTESYFPMALAMGYSLSQTNNLPAQNAEMVLFVRIRANISMSALDKLQKVGWKLRMEEDIVLPAVDFDQINPWHKWNLNKLQCWSWTEYDQILFIDSDSLVKADLSEVWNTPGVIAAAPDAWDHTAKDTKFNSGVLLLRPSEAEYRLLLRALATPGMHLPEEGDQPFLNRFYEYRYFGLPHGYNLNLVLYKWFPMVWEFLWPRAKIVHFTVRKPRRPGEWCVGACPEKGALEWYADVFQEMVENYGYVRSFHSAKKRWLDEIELYG